MWEKANPRRETRGGAGVYHEMDQGYSMRKFTLGIGPTIGWRGRGEKKKEKSGDGRILARSCYCKIIGGGKLEVRKRKEGKGRRKAKWSINEKGSLWPTEKRKKGKND